MGISKTEFIVMTAAGMTFWLAAVAMTYWFGDTPIDSKVEDGVHFIKMKSGIENWRAVDASAYWIYRAHGTLGPGLVFGVMLWLGIKLLRQKFGR